MILKWSTYSDRETLTVEENYSSLTIRVKDGTTENEVKYSVARDQFVNMISAMGVTPSDR